MGGCILFKSQVGFSSVSQIPRYSANSLRYKVVCTYLPVHLTKWMLVKSAQVMEETSRNESDGKELCFATVMPSMMIACCADRRASSADPDFTFGYMTDEEYSALTGKGIDKRPMFAPFPYMFLSAPIILQPRTSR